MEDRTGERDGREGDRKRMRICHQREDKTDKESEEKRRGKGRGMGREKGRGETSRA